MRLSTAAMHRSSINSILEQQSRMAKTQEQVTTGKKFQTASEDPIGAARAAGLDRKLADNEQYGRNSNIIKSRLSYEEQTLADMTSVPASPMALAISGQACSLRSTRTFARRRRCAHHGTDNITAPMTSACGSGVTWGPTAVAAESHIPVT